MTPYELLGVDSNADDKAIRNAYLELIKTYPPDRAPDRFKEIASAYETVKDEKNVWNIICSIQTSPSTGLLRRCCCTCGRQENENPQTLRN